VEAVFPIEDPEKIDSVLNDLEKILSDNEGASMLKKDGTYTRIKPHAKSKTSYSSQKALLAKSANHQAVKEDSKLTTPPRKPKN
jgi:polyphosphate kinase